MSQSRLSDPSSFTVVMPSVLRGRFERWLKREHLQMRPATPTADRDPLPVDRYFVAPPKR